MAAGSRSERFLTRVPEEMSAHSAADCASVPKVRLGFTDARRAVRRSSLNRVCQYCSLWKDRGVWMFKTDHNLWRTSKGDQYRSSSETGMCWVYWAAFASTPPRGCRAQQITTASASPSWGRFFGVESKKTARNGPVFHAEKFGTRPPI
jgi:hypothetical protein